MDTLLSSVLRRWGGSLFSLSNGQENGRYILRRRKEDNRPNKNSASLRYQNGLLLMFNFLFKDLSVKQSHRYHRTEFWMQSLSETAWCIYTDSVQSLCIVSLLNSFRMLEKLGTTSAPNFLAWANLWWSQTLRMFFLETSTEKKTDTVNMWFCKLIQVVASFGVCSKTYIAQNRWQHRKQTARSNIMCILTFLRNKANRTEYPSTSLVSLYE